MREIKFRAWDKSEERMVYSGTKQNDYPFVWQIHNTGIEIVEHDGTNWNTIKDLVFMQYTGLKDKNGKEIYEGDIVEAKDPYKYNSKEIFYTCEVVFTEGAAFMLKHTYENWGTVGIRYFGLRDMELEVIGNIYENPELLI